MRLRRLTRVGSEGAGPAPSRPAVGVVEGAIRAHGPTVTDDGVRQYTACISTARLGGVRGVTDRHRDIPRSEQPGRGERSEQSEQAAPSSTVRTSTL
jgi:hypothetical protein